MVRRRKDIVWAGTLKVDDLALIQQRIDLRAWYPMESFERLGLAILANFGGTGLDAVRLWGSFSASRFAQDEAGLLAEGDPVESLMRLKVMRATLFDFPAFDIPTVVDGHAIITLNYQMQPSAEEAACHQTLGFCEGIVNLAGGRSIQGAFRECRWQGAAKTTVRLDWQRPGQ